MLEKLKNLLSSLNQNGIPFPLARDNKTGRGSYSKTFIIISSLYVQIGLIGKFTKLLEGIDMVSALSWFLICIGIDHFNRRIIINKEQGVILESKDDNSQNEKGN
jgi:hypothetical protein